LRWRGGGVSSPSEGRGRSTVDMQRAAQDRTAESTGNDPRIASTRRKKQCRISSPAPKLVSHLSRTARSKVPRNSYNRFPDRISHPSVTTSRTSTLPPNSPTSLPESPLETNLPTKEQSLRTRTPHIGILVFHASERLFLDFPPSFQCSGSTVRTKRSRE